MSENKLPEQLIKKNCSSGEYDNLYPVTTLDAVTDPRTGASLEASLDSCNHLYLPFTQNSRAITRCQVPKYLRRKGLWITYTSCRGESITEWYKGEDFSDTEWSKTENWMEYINPDYIKTIIDTIVDWYKA